MLWQKTGFQLKSQKQITFGRSHANNVARTIVPHQHLKNVRMSDTCERVQKPRSVRDHG